MFPLALTTAHVTAATIPCNPLLPLLSSPSTSRHCFSLLPSLPPSPSFHHCLPPTSCHCFPPTSRHCLSSPISRHCLLLLPSLLPSLYLPSLPSPPPVTASFPLLPSLVSRHSLEPGREPIASMLTINILLAPEVLSAHLIGLYFCSSWTLFFYSWFFLYNGVRRFTGGVYMSMFIFFSLELKWNVE